jgi:hypothetical protein
MRRQISKVLILFNIIICIIFCTTISVSSNPATVRSWVNVVSKKTFSSNNYLNNSLGVQTSKNYENLSFNFSLNLKENSLSFDDSYLESQYKNTTFGIGKIKRNWSFSPKTSLILSSNARPSNSVYLTFNNTQRPQNLLFSWVGPWTVESFNSMLSNTNGPKNSMLFGLRFKIKPIYNLQFELIKTSQWGGEGYDQSLSSLAAMFFGDTNNSTHSNINQMAGIGFSYAFRNKKMPITIYGQIVGEDEAGYLPTCNMLLFGTEFNSIKGKYFKKIGFEFIDTRINYTTTNYCGPNTAYNNHVYKYTNYGKSLGAPIDTESKSYSIWVTKTLSKVVELNYLLKHNTINDANWANHRLSTARKDGWSTEVGTTWKLDALSINSRINYQNLELDRINVPQGISFQISADYVF